NGQETLVKFEDLADVLLRVLVRKVDIGYLDERRFANLLPHVECFRKAVCRVPKYFTSRELFIRSLSELFLARELHVGEIAGEADSCNLFTLPCVQRCRLLRFDCAYTLSTSLRQMVDWLCSGGEKKTFAVRLADNIPAKWASDVVGIARRRFKRARSRTEFKLTVTAHLSGSNEGLFSTIPIEEINKRTGEALVMSSEVTFKNAERYVRMSFVRALQSAHG
ncbi:hypothetical protein AAVH_36713, partial [Aphelenchoides avenae]